MNLDSSEVPGRSSSRHRSRSEGLLLLLDVDSDMADVCVRMVVDRRLRRRNDDENIGGKEIGKKCAAPVACAPNVIKIMKTRHCAQCPHTTFVRYDTFVFTLKGKKRENGQN